jgi:hypothetical protein
MTEQPSESPVPPPDGPGARFEDLLLDLLAGEWTVARRIGNRMEENRAEAEWILNHRFLRIHMIDVKDPPGYEALVLVGFDHAEGRYVIHWLDTFGGRFSEKGFGTREGESIRFVFQYPDGTLHNTFTWNGESRTWRSLIEQRNDLGDWSVFAEDHWQRA